MNSSNFSLDALLDDLAERVALRLEARLGTGGPLAVARRLLTVEQAAAYLGRTEAAVRHLVQSDSLRVVRADRRVLLDRVDLDRWIEVHKDSVSR